MHTMQTESCVRFNSAGHALSYFNQNNPARLKRQNLLEPDSSGSGKAKDFTGESPDHIWSRVLGCLTRVLHEEPHVVQLCFILRNVGERDDYGKRKPAFHREPARKQLSVQEIATQLNISKRTVYRYLNRISDEFERELKRQELLIEEGGTEERSDITYEIIKRIK